MRGRLHSSRVKRDIPPPRHQGRSSAQRTSATKSGSRRTPSFCRSDGIKRVAQQAGVDSNQPTISFCNTGHWAATNWFVLSELLGHKDVKLYPESVVDWSNAGLAMENVPSRLQQFWLQLKLASRVRDWPPSWDRLGRRHVVGARPIKVADLACRELTARYWGHCAWLAITWLVGLRQGFLFLVGIGFGAVLASVSFGFTTGWRVWIRERDPTGFLAQLLAIGFAMLVSIPLIASHDELSGAIAPLSVSLVIGAFVFGAAMQIADGCGSGTLYKAGLGNGFSASLCCPALSPAVFSALPILIAGWRLAVCPRYRCLSIWVLG